MKTASGSGLGFGTPLTKLAEREAALRPPHESRRLHRRNRRSAYGSGSGGLRNAR